jgi:putative hydrolase of the HAD superfamily
MTQPSPPSKLRPTIRAIVFDCFGVLYEDAFKAFVDEHTRGDANLARQYYDLAAASDRGLISDDDFYRQLSALSGQDVPTLVAQMTDTSALNRPIADLIRTLRAQGRYKIGLLSNVDRRFLDRFLAAHHIAGQLDAVLASSETPFAKPDEQIFTAMSDRLGITPAEMLFIDDSPGHTTAARSYGIPAITYQNPHQLQQELAKMLP